MTGPELIDSLIAAHAERIGSQGVLAFEAMSLATTLAAEHPTEWAEWVSAYVDELVLDRLRKLARAHRRAVALTPAGVFAQWAEAPTAERSPYVATYCVNEKHEWRALADMMRPELLFVAEHRESLSRAALLEAAFMRALVARLPDDTTPVGAVWTEAELRALRQ